MSKALGEKTQQALPWDTYRDALRESAKKLYDLKRGSVRAPDFESFWYGALQRGGWWDTNASGSLRATPPRLPLQLAPASFAGPEKDGYLFHLTIFPSIGLYDGRGAHLPWLQMTPDPTTTVMWQSWLEMNPETAAAMGLRANDIVAVESPAGRLEAPLYVYPAIPPNVVAMPAGQGHTYMGRYAERRGANPLSILAPLAEADTGALAWGATRVRILKTGRQYNLPKLEGAVPAREPEDYKIVQVTNKT